MLIPFVRFCEDFRSFRVMSGPISCSTPVKGQINLCKWPNRPKRQDVNFKPKILEKKDETKITNEKNNEHRFLLEPGTSKKIWNTSLQNTSVTRRTALCRRAL